MRAVENIGEICQKWTTSVAFPYVAALQQGEAMAKRNKLAKQANPDEFLSHWPKLIECFQFSSKEFYARVERALDERKVPDLRAELVDWKEAGPLSARREYLELSRERLVFDICAAPFGTGFFVSLWFREKPLKLGLFVLIFSLLAVFAALDYFVRFRNGIFHFAFFNLQMSWTGAAWTVIGVFASAVFALAVVLGARFDRTVSRIPLVGYVYQRFLRRETLYRVDQRCMYLAAVHQAVTDVIDEITKAQGIPPLSELDRRPAMRGLFHLQGANGRN